MLDGYIKRRDQLSIVVTILQIARYGARKTKIMFNANLNFSQLNGYITFLVDKGLICQHMAKGKELYAATRKGVLFAQRYSELLCMIEAEPQPDEKGPLVT